MAEQLDQFVIGRRCAAMTRADIGAFLGLTSNLSRHDTRFTLFAGPCSRGAR
jgi:hypothetical protein